MGNAITANVNLDHELHYEQEAIEAGKLLTGKVIFQVQSGLAPTSLTLEVNGKEKTAANVGGQKLQDKHCFFRSDVELYRDDKPVEPNTYVFPFQIPLPKSLPASRSHEDSEGSYSIVYNLKLKTKTPGKFPNKRSFEVISMSRLDESVPCLLQPKAIEPEAIGIDAEGFLFLGAHVKDTNVFKGKELKCSLACRNESTLRIDRAIVTLEEEYYFTTKSFGGHGTSNIVEKNDAKRLPGIRAIGIHVKDIDDQMIDEETLARRMFKDLKSKDNIISLKIPQTIQESYSGLIIQVSHFLRFSVIPRNSNDEPWPSIRIPIHVGSEEPVKKEMKDLNSYSDHVSERARVRFPVAKARPEFTVVGRNAGVLENEDSFSNPIPVPVNGEPSVAILREEIAASINDYDYLVDKMKDLDWAIFFASLAPDDYGSIIALVGTDFAQPRVAALLASNYGGDFTCAHCAAAIRNVAPVFRSNVVEALLTYCCDLSENNHRIRNELSDFEQIIVALHALNEDNEMVEEEAVNDRSASGRQVPEEPAVPTDIIVQIDSEDEEKTPSEMTLDLALMKDASPGNAATSRNKIPRPPQKMASSLVPRPMDILIGVKDHDPTMKLFNAIKEEVEKGAFSEYCPPVYRRIKKNFGKEQRFLIRPSRNNPSHWREATNIELIEHCGTIFDALKEEKDSERSDSENWHDSGLWIGSGPGPRNGKKRWQQALNKGASSSWELAVTVHTYTSGIDETSEGPEPLQGPALTDICFFKPKHPGNAILIRSLRVVLQHNPDVSFSPPIYRAIKKPLAGRRFFVKVGERAWREATQPERRENIERYFELEKKRASQKREKSRNVTASPSNIDKSASRQVSGGADGRERSKSRQSMPSAEPVIRSKSPSVHQRSKSPSIHRSKSPSIHQRRSKSPSIHRSKSPSIHQRTSPRLKGRKSVTGRKSLSAKDGGDIEFGSPKSPRRISSREEGGRSSRHSSTKEGSSGGDRAHRRSMLGASGNGERRPSNISDGDSTPSERKIRRSNSAGKYSGRDEGSGHSSPGRMKVRRSNSMGKFSPVGLLASPRHEKRRTRSTVNAGFSPRGQKTRTQRSMSMQGPPISSIEINGNSSSGHLRAGDSPSEKGGRVPPNTDGGVEGELALNDTPTGGKENESESQGLAPALRRLFRKDSIRSISKRNMRHPRDMDICHGSSSHPGTQAWMEAVLKAVHKSAGKNWSNALYKGIQKDLNGRRHFLREKGESTPWREATAEERVSLTKNFFEAKRRERRGSANL